MLSEYTSQIFHIRVFWNLEQKQKNVFDSLTLNQCSTYAVVDATGLTGWGKPGEIWQLNVWI